MSHNERGQTSRPFVMAEIQTDCNFEAHVSYHNCFGLHLSSLLYRTFGITL